jgi:hypothetical protein
MSERARPSSPKNPIRSSGCYAMTTTKGDEHEGVNKFQSRKLIKKQNLNCFGVLVYTFLEGFQFLATVPLEYSSSRHLEEGLCISSTAT